MWIRCVHVLIKNTKMKFILNSRYEWLVKKKKEIISSNRLIKFNIKIMVMRNLQRWITSISLTLNKTKF